jgi:hypothetical protein
MVQRLTGSTAAQPALAGASGVPREFLFILCDLPRQRAFRLQPAPRPTPRGDAPAIEPDAIEPEPMGFGEIPIGQWSPDVETRIAPEVLNATMTFDGSPSDEPHQGVAPDPRSAGHKGSTTRASPRPRSRPTRRRRPPARTASSRLRELPVMGRLDQRRAV